MTKKTRKNADWKLYLTVGLLALVILIVGKSASGALDWKSFLLNRIDNVIEQKITSELAGMDEEDMTFGGLVHFTQEIFPQGIKAGVREREIINANGVLSNIIYGGGTLATTTGADTTTTDICKYDTFLVSPVLAAGSTVRFPSTTTLYSTDTGCLFNIGDRKDVYFYNATTGASTVTVKFDVYNRTGIQLMGTSTDPTNHTIVINPTEALRATFWRVSTATTTVLTEFFRDAD